MSLPNNCSRRSPLLRAQRSNPPPHEQFPSTYCSVGRVGLVAAASALHLTRRRKTVKVRRLNPDRGREGFCTSPPSEPYERFSRIRLSSRWFPHRDCLAF